MQRKLSIIACCLLGIALLTFGGTQAFRTHRYLGKKSKASGSVIALERERFTPGRGSSVKSYAPVVRFRTDTGEETIFTSGHGSFPPEYEVGSTVSVVYNRLQPQHAEIDNFRALWFVSTLAIGMGMVAIGIGLLLLRRRQHSLTPEAL